LEEPKYQCRGGVVPEIYNTSRFKSRTRLEPQDFASRLRALSSSPKFEIFTACSEGLRKCLQDGWPKLPQRFRWMEPYNPSVFFAKTGGIYLNDTYPTGKSSINWLSRVPSMCFSRISYLELLLLAIYTFSRGKIGELLKWCLAQDSAASSSPCMYSFRPYISTRHVFIFTKLNGLPSTFELYFLPLGRHLCYAKDFGV